MRHISRAQDGAVRGLFVSLFSGTIASAFLTGLVHSSIYWSGQFGGWEMGLNHSFHRRLNDSLGESLAFFIWSLALALVGFLLLRISSRVSFVTKVLQTIAGVMLVAVPPLCLWFVESYRPELLYEGGAWLRFEGCLAVGCALLFACNRWSFSTRITVALVTIHSAMWVHAYWVTFERLGFWWLTAPILAYFSTLMWGYYARRQQEGTLQQSPT